MVECSSSQTEELTGMSLNTTGNEINKSPQAWLTSRPLYCHWEWPPEYLTTTSPLPDPSYSEYLKYSVPTTTGWSGWCKRFCWSSKWTCVCCQRWIIKTRLWLWGWIYRMKDYNSLHYQFLRICFHFPQSPRKHPSYVSKTLSQGKYSTQYSTVHHWIHTQSHYCSHFLLLYLHKYVQCDEYI